MISAPPYASRDSGYNLRRLQVEWATTECSKLMQCPDVLIYYAKNAIYPMQLRSPHNWPCEFILAVRCNTYITHSPDLTPEPTYIPKSGGKTKGSRRMKT